ncbi:hypothetical protein [Candidatus Nitrosotalea bavarica]|uniref:hypothetical protein n=1 Tax=Candidatus Nitrosotalea bavarica TaxID=1903277 RepID=UPI001055E087|nr:hypothetical protein [Candidatus Nitrosotalea bavarica]
MLIVLAGIVAAIVYSYYQQEASKGQPWVWITSGPFSINKNQYKLGEHIFIVVSDLKPTDVGEIDIVDPKGDTYSKIPFNGTIKSSFKQFFEPNTERNLSLCNATSLVGHWNIIFDGVPYKSIPFEIINEYIPEYSNKTEGLDTVPKGLDPC